MPQPRPYNDKKRVPQKIERATYEQRLGLFSGGKTTKAEKKKNSWLSTYAVKKNMISFETLNNIHAIFSMQKN